MLTLVLIGKSLWRERGLFGLWILSLCLTVTGLLVVDVYRNSLSQTLRVQGQKILTADLAISMRRPLTENEKKALAQIVDKDATSSTLTEMFAMVSHKESQINTTRLALLRFIDDAYPLLGDLVIDHDGISAASHGTSISTQPLAWVAADILTLMHVKTGDELKIGSVTFKIAGVIRKDSSQTLRFGSMAPRIYIHRRFLDHSGLIKFGSTYSENLFISTPGIDANLKGKIENLFSDPSVQVTVPTDLEASSFRVLSRLLDFLGLTGLVTLCLGWIGVYYLGRRWLTLEAASVGILKCLGLAEWELRNYLLLKLCLIMAAGISSGGLLAWLTAKGIMPFVQDSLPAEFLLTWSWPSTLLIMMIGPLAGLLLMWPALRAVCKEQALSLIHGLTAFRTSFWDLTAFAGTTALLFFIITFAQARSWRVTFIFLGALGGTVITAAAIGYLIVRLSERLNPQAWRGHLVVSLWTRRPALAVLMITISALAGLLSQLVPNLEKTLVGELQSPAEMERPALFLIDIQDEQRGPLLSFLKEAQIEESESAPFIRARILKINDSDFERAQTPGWSTREQEMDRRLRNRGINLSYRNDLSPSEKILSGKSWHEMSRNSNKAEISVEQGYADRLNLKLGDVLRFDVQGQELSATVVSLREVDWNSFQPNFFIMFPPGVLDEAPKTWIMTIRRSSQIKAVQMQALISERFANITSLNVQETLDVVAELFGKLSSGLKLASGLCLALGIFVFLMVLLFQLASSERDWMQLYILGLRNREILSLQILTYGGLCLIGILLGALMSLAVAALLARFAFHTHLLIDWLKMSEIFFISLFSGLAGMLILALRANHGYKLNQVSVD